MDEPEALAAMLALIDRHGLDAIAVRVGPTSYELVRSDPSRLPATTVVGHAPVTATAAGHAETALPQAAANYKKVTAPIVGVFYRAPSPGVQPFVEPGDRVEVGQVLCILEAMKLMNEITSDFAGVVRRVLPENGQLVSLGEELIWIEP